MIMMILLYTERQQKLITSSERHGCVENGDRNGCVAGKEKREFDPREAAVYTR